MAKIIIGAVIAVLIIAGIFIWISQSSSNNNQDIVSNKNQENQNVSNKNQENQNNQLVNESGMQSLETFKITGKNYEFNMYGIKNPDMRVIKGDKIKIQFSSTEGYHDWVIDEFNARTQKVNPEDGVVTVEFIADKIGTFEYYCSVGSHRSMGMKGKFIVVE